MPPTDAGARGGWASPAAAAIAAALVVQAAYVAGSGFYLDDVRNLADARRGGLAPSFLVRPLFEHFAPGHRVLDWLAVAPFGPSHAVAAVLLLAFGAAGLGYLAGLLNLRWPERPVRNAVLVFVCGTSWTALGTGQWFAGAAHALPALAAMTAALYHFERWRTGGRAGHWAAAFAAAVIGLLFWVQAVLIPVFIAGLALTAPEFRVWRRLDRPALWRIARALAPFVVLSAAYLVWLRSRAWSPATTVPSARQAADLVRTMLARGFLPSLTGTGLPNEQETSWERAMQVVAALLLLGGLATALMRPRRWIAGPALFAGLLLAIGVTVAGGRLTQIGALAAGNEPRYLTMLPLALVLAVAVFCEPRGAPRLAIPVPAAVASAGAAAAAALYLANLSGTYQHRSFSRATAAAANVIATNLDADVAAARRHGDAAGIVDSELPFPIFYPGRTDENELSRLAPYFDPGLRPAGSGARLLEAGGDGHLVPVTLTPVPGAGAQCTAGRCRVRSRGVAKAPDGAMLYARVPAPAGTTVRLSATGPGVVKDGFRPVVVPAGADHVVIPVWSPASAPVTVAVGGGVRGLQLGTLSPAA